LNSVPSFECTGGPSSCSDLLSDPLSVLSDRQRWPSHLCKDFYLESTKRWIHSAVAPEAADTFPFKWFEGFPIPIGRSCFERRRTYDRKYPKHYLPLQQYVAVLHLVPFEGYVDAAWALRVTRAGAMLDLFALTVRQVDENGVRYVGDELAYVLRGRDTSLIELVTQADRWWTGIRGETIQGRPPGTGRWRSADDFEQALREAVWRLHAGGHKVTQEEIAGVLYCNARQLRRWLRHYDIKWEDISKAL
jgi:hypothetical protein